MDLEYSRTIKKYAEGIAKLATVPVTNVYPFNSNMNSELIRLCGYPIREDHFQMVKEARKEGRFAGCSVKTIIETLQKEDEGCTIHMTIKYLNDLLNEDKGESDKKKTPTSKAYSIPDNHLKCCGTFQLTTFPPHPPHFQMQPIERVIRVIPMLIPPPIVNRLPYARNLCNRRWGSFYVCHYNGAIFYNRPVLYCLKPYLFSPYKPWEYN